MHDAIFKADVLVEAMSYIRRFRGKYVVIKLGGSALEQDAAVKSFLTDVLFLETVGMKPILIHGGGKDISRAMEAEGFEPKFVQGRRYTDQGAMEIVARTLTGISDRLAEQIESLGGKAMPLHFGTYNSLIGERITLPGENGAPIDLGQVGQVVDIAEPLLRGILSEGKVPVLPSVVLDRAGGKLNVNADTAAAAVARLLKAEKLVFLSDVPGIFMDRSEPESLLKHLSIDRVRELIQQGVIDGGMIPKVEAALEALEAGVGKVHLVDARMPHSVLLEIYSASGVGTEIVKAASPPV
ncbi:acetylglutamate kinase [Stratiformator vulcanicus]|uniref:Acetylglutamate kinase n=1 Tax=Stratiformator vulcanicus TaxID=2527980 RepID=A0A517R1C8_9PLAN|nr:acetylglutamate kinase [Stratiformator vulcanicus]QDT37640.1 Acetylglutamate kinase [Stratiformator vulcanicus]